MPTVTSRFFKMCCANILPDCWAWFGTKNQAGYGRFRIGKRLRSAHRVAYELFVGPLPDKTQVLHLCDNRSCVNPAHLFLGDVQTNMSDMARKGRGKKSSIGLATGVFISGKKFGARLFYKKRDIYLGLFLTQEEAIAAIQRKKADLWSLS